MITSQGGRGRSLGQSRGNGNSNDNSNVMRGVLVLGVMIHRQGRGKEKTVIWDCTLVSAFNLVLCGWRC
jgi:hypothetical protein